MKLGEDVNSEYGGCRQGPATCLTVSCIMWNQGACLKASTPPATMVQSTIHRNYMTVHDRENGGLDWPLL